MTDDLVVGAVRRAVPPTNPAGWHDVLDRAGRRRRRLRRKALTICLVALALAAAIPALAVSGQLTFGSHDRGPRVRLHAALRFASGEPAGRLELQLPGLLIGGRFRVPRLLVRTDHRLRVAHRFELRWWLRLRFSDRAARATLNRLGGPRTTRVLCIPCQSTSEGRLVVSAAFATALVNNRVEVVATTDRGRARGRVRLSRLRR
jgi:hypothetical protein